MTVNMNGSEKMVTLQDDLQALKLLIESALLDMSNMARKQQLVGRVEALKFEESFYTDHTTELPTFGSGMLVRFNLLNALDHVFTNQNNRHGFGTHVVALQACVEDALLFLRGN